MVARKIPWLTEAAKSRPRHRPVTPSRQTREASPTSDLDHSPVRREPTNNLDDVPSSPTAAPMSAPEVEYMREGFDQDDGYIMVEDEFFSTAQWFTRHLHHEEYVRRKTLAKSRMREALENDERGVDVSTRQTAETRLKLKSRDVSRGIKRAMEDQLEEDYGPRNTHLSSLSARDNLASLDLSALIPSKVKTKAVAGIRPRQNVLDKMQPVASGDGMGDDSDDLDEQPRRPSIVDNRNAMHSAGHDRDIHSGMSSRASTSTNAMERRVPMLEVNPLSRATIADFNTADTLHEDRSQQRAATADFLAKRRSALEKKRLG